jgi:hypothetical protein
VGFSAGVDAERRRGGVEGEQTDRESEEREGRGIYPAAYGTGEALYIYRVLRRVGVYANEFDQLARTRTTERRDWEVGIHGSIALH